MKIFVTGASGFIGSHLVEKLAGNGHKVKALVPYNVENSWGWIDSFEKSKRKPRLVRGFFVAYRSSTVQNHSRLLLGVIRAANGRAQTSLV